jgi:hypothetical protein
MPYRTQREKERQKKDRLRVVATLFAASMMVFSVNRAHNFQSSKSTVGFIVRRAVRCNLHIADGMFNTETLHLSPRGDEGPPMVSNVVTYSLTVQSQNIYIYIYIYTYTQYLVLSRTSYVANNCGFWIR